MERSTQTRSIAFAFRRQRAARSAKEYKARVPAGAQPRSGPAVISVMIPITGVVVAVTLGRSSHGLPRPSMCVACASRKQKEALSVRETDKAAADGKHR